MKIKKEFKKHTGSKGKRKINIILSVLLVLTAACLMIFNVLYNKTHYVPEFYKLSSNKISDSVRIVFLSDLHLREYGEGNKELITDIKSLAPDLILLGGDLVNEDCADYENMLSLCRNISDIAPAYGVWGNHESVKMYIQGDRELSRRFKDTGVCFLENEVQSVKIKGNKLVLCGLSGNAGEFEKYGAKEATKRFSDETGFKIMLAHVPTYFTEKLEEFSFDLGVSGHVHGGIVNIPRLGALYSAEEGFFPKYSGGMYSLSNGANLLVSRGLGDSGMAVRINNVPELSVIDIG